MWDLTVPGNGDHNFYVLPAGQASRARDSLRDSPVDRTAVLVHNQSLCGNASTQAVDHVDWAREGRGPYANPARQRAFDYESGAPGARIDPQTGQRLVPRLSMPGRGNDMVTAKFDGLQGDEIIDRKNGVLPFTTDSMIDEARRQAATSAYHGLQAVWEVPNSVVEQEALRWLGDAGVSNIIVRIVP